MATEAIACLELGLAKDYPAKYDHSFETTGTQHLRPGAAAIWFLLRWPWRNELTFRVCSKGFDTLPWPIPDATEGRKAISGLSF